MNVAVEKTQQIKRMDIAIHLLDPNPDNPNKMSDAEFNLLYDNMEKVGIVDPIFVRDTGDGRYRVIGGHHRLEVAKLHGFEVVPCTVVDDPTFDVDQEKFQIVRMNMIRGKMDPSKFLKMYEEIAPKYGDEFLKDAFGFTEEKEFRKMIQQVQKELPAQMKEAFKNASDSIKTVDDLAKVLNALYTKHGDTLTYGYMLIDFGGKDSIWLRMSDKTKKALFVLGARCHEESRTMDALLGGIVQLIADGDAEDLLAKAVAASPEVQLPNDSIELPTEDFLEQLQ